MNDEHNWHACSTPEWSTKVAFEWRCPVCNQLWLWCRPPRPMSQWVRREAEQRT